MIIHFSNGREKLLGFLNLVVKEKPPWRLRDEPNNKNLRDGDETQVELKLPPLRIKRDEESGDNLAKAVGNEQGDACNRVVADPVELLESLLEAHDLHKIEQTDPEAPARAK